MRRSTDRILVTHTGSLPRPDSLIELIFKKEQEQPVDPAEFDREAQAAVAGIVRKQREVGVDIANDGEQPKVSYASYVKSRCSGFGGDDPGTGGARDLNEFPDYARMASSTAGMTRLGARRVACIGPVEYTGHAELARDLAYMKAAVGSGDPRDFFMSAAGPGVASIFQGNQFYPTHDEYVWALAKALRTEYTAITDAGFTLQVDCPDLAMGRHSKYKDQSLEEFRRTIATNIEALNWALEGIAPAQARIHLCWGNYEGPHHHDVPLADIIDLVLGVKADGISLEASNPRHAHEWQLFETVKLPAGKYLIPGVIDSTTNFIEHPRLIAQRLLRYAGVVGKENVMAGTDCGFSTGAGNTKVFPPITWKKFEAMAEGAAIASKELWSR
jgi:5-methyltetrahydropteroyltriglutamate--homocysteine methyltransferase